MKRIVASFITICALLAWSVPASALIVTLDSGTNWRATTDPLRGNQWLLGNFTPGDGAPAFAPYPNSITAPQDIIDNVDDKVNTAGRLMWACNGGSLCRNSSGVIDGASGPIQAFFRLDFRLNQRFFDNLVGIRALVDVIADDFFELTLNGAPILSGFLDDNKTNGQPDPLRLNVLDMAKNLKVGPNVFAIRAFDGSEGTGPADRGFEHVFVDGQLELESSVPEPTTLALFGVGLAALGFATRRRKAA